MSNCVVCAVHRPCYASARRRFRRQALDGQGGLSRTQLCRFQPKSSRTKTAMATAQSTAHMGALRLWHSWSQPSALRNCFFSPRTVCATSVSDNTRRVERWLFTRLAATWHRTAWFQVEYPAGEKNTWADAISRRRIALVQRICFNLAQLASTSHNVTLHAVAMTGRLFSQSHFGHATLIEKDVLP